MTDDRQQHIDTLAATLKHAAGWNPGTQNRWEWDAESVFDSTDMRVHDALTAALIAHADRGRVLAALADAGWLGEDKRLACPGCRSAGVVGHPVLGRIFHGPGCEHVGTATPEEQRRYVSEWEAP